jgi:AcrR family transcriptional regulator
MEVKRRQVERSEETVAALMKAAGALFGDRGYAAVSAEDIAAAANVTKGALYHHFDGKPAVFEAVFIAAQQQLTASVAGESGEVADVWNALLVGTNAFLRQCLDQRVRQIVILDGPTVLGRDAVREIEDDNIGSLLTGALRRLQDAGILRPGDSLLRSRLILGALCEAALFIARSETPDHSLVEARGEVASLIDGFRA